MIDDRLRELLYKVYEDPSVAKHKDYIAQIKQVFLDSMAQKRLEDALTPNQLMTRAEWEEQAKKEGWIKSPIKPDTKSIYAPTIEDDTRVFMTGQAWFDRFKEELNKDMIANQPSNITEDPIRIIEAAKRASGVKDECICGEHFKINCKALYHE